jgi:hypothetical protein
MMAPDAIPLPWWGVLLARAAAVLVLSIWVAESAGLIGRVDEL